MNLIGRLQLLQSTSEEGSSDVVSFRQMRLEEAIVRLMKTRKTLPFTEMYDQVVGLLANQFVPSKRMFKETLEVLIEKHYLERDMSKGIDTFNYIT